MLESVLRVSESIITYRRRYRSTATVGTVLDLLLSDPANPRSLTYQLDRITEDLRALPADRAAGRVGAAERRALEASTALRVADTSALAGTGGTTVRADLDEFLAHLYGLLTAAGEALAATYFSVQLPQRVMSTSVDRPVGAPPTGVAAGGPR